MLIPHFTPQQLYAVVADVTAYHEFVPWVVGSHIVRRPQVRGGRSPVTTSTKQFAWCPLLCPLTRRSHVNALFAVASCSVILSFRQPNVFYAEMSVGMRLFKETYISKVELTPDVAVTVRPCAPLRPTTQPRHHRRRRCT